MFLPLILQQQGIRGNVGHPRNVNVCGLVVLGDGFGTEWMTSSFYVSSCILWLSVTYQCSERERDKAKGTLHIRIRNSLTQLPKIGVLIICCSFLRCLFGLVPCLKRIQPKYLLFTIRAGSDGSSHKVFVGGNMKILTAAHSQFLPSNTNLKHIQLQLLLLKYIQFRTSCLYLFIYLFIFIQRLYPHFSFPSFHSSLSQSSLSFLLSSSL
jgi:hypothetical protein